MIDFGSYDGRIVIEAAKRFGVPGMGVSIPLYLCKEQGATPAC